MKKKLLVLLLVVSLIASLAVGLAACNKEDEEKTTEKASNSETIATAVAMIGNSGAVAAAEETQEDGLNLDFGASASLVAMIPGFSAFQESMNEYIQDYVEMASEYAKENSVSVKKGEVAAEDKAHEGSVCYDVTVTGKDEEGKDVVTAQYKLYIKATKADKSEADIEGSEDYNFALSLAYKDGEDYVDVPYSISGSAKFDAEINGMKFNFSMAELTALKADAYATESGSIIVDINTTIAGITVGAKVEVGKLSDSSYGAKVDATVAVGTTFSANVVVNIVANKSADAEHDFALTGNADITLSTYKATANLTGYADYDYSAEDETMEMDFSLNGTVSLAQTQSK